ncbi:expressed unknown protein [Seminavis robusta]|uniref:Secreted protein n=1 Tax=Seminavis robusta TaxID=568900 RepID=A0A9N8DA21_9STRA|nr:expressed unknown protein [Seminavis robusta]|eukprot:Sro29_g019280.1 n/a (168) ;mRNA; f:131389-131892
MKSPTTLLLLAFLVGSSLRQGVEAVAFLNPNRPPIGATYEKAIGIPVLGRQTFSLRILSDDTAHLLVKGMLFLDEVIPYTITSGGCLDCSLSENALRCMRKVRASLQEVGYDGVTDTPYVKVSTPLPVPVKIHLKRKDSMDELMPHDSVLHDEDTIMNNDDDGFELF